MKPQPSCEQKISDLKIMPTRFSVHQLVLDLRPHRAWIYWPDLLLSAMGFWLCLFFAWRGAASLASVVGLSLLAVLFLYRGALFVHEIEHFSKGVLPGFEWAWNALLGWPMLFPSFFIRSHPDHHRIASYGTANDPEYLPFSKMSRSQLLRYALSAMLTPWLLILRAIAIVPLAWIRPAAKRWLRRHASRMSMNNAYQPSAADIQLSRAHEWSEMMTVLCAYAWVGMSWIGMLPAWFLIDLLLIQMLAHGVNAWRTIHAHAYESTGVPMDHLKQVHDSTNFKLSAILGFILCPVGQRFHATHHLFPYLPYHSLGIAHQRVLKSGWSGLDSYKQSFR